MLENKKNHDEKVEMGGSLREMPKVGKTRLESDSLGSLEIEENAYYGIQSRRAKENFPLSGQRIHRKLIRGMGFVKYACIEANLRTGSISKEIGEAIKKACKEFISGQYDDQIIVESIQGGAGTSINMNVNEVIANRALEILGKEKGRYDIISPNTHVNMAQSTNDVVPTAFKIAVLMMKENLINSLEELHKALQEKEREFDGIVAVGRTHLQDAIPIRLGQEFGAYARLVGRDVKRIAESMECLCSVNLGATAVGTGLNADPAYIKAAIEELRKISGMDVQLAEHLVDATQNTDCYVHLSSAIRICALNISKMCNDLRLLSSGPICGFMEIKLPPVQPGSSIMPGKVNPVMAEMMNQVCFQIQGNDHAIAMASEAGQFQLNVMAPVIFKNMFEAIEILTNGANVFTNRCIRGIEANTKQCFNQVNKSLGVITALNPHIGYEKSSEIAKEALETKRSVRELVLEKGILTDEELDMILQPQKMTEPGIAGMKRVSNS
ncbi:aspartate ammonia-lyase [Maledivibacter halophilus]|uniref:aspartate ammonia-lyase n=1 Tax=Maledivibacter halophilus TaxID=36842 RepID=A0A1T5LMN0_9FIRM|nr:aspartate ammonia-lyase [Maledivibacter halophilus]SKC76789.1 aspartate ammonia-lyase [Maledivibacter halophilus]